MLKMKMVSTAGVRYMDHIILDKILRKYGSQFVVMINTVMNKFQDLISMKFGKSECIKISRKFDNRGITWCRMSSPAISVFPSHPPP